MEVTVIPIVVGELGTISKGLVKEMEDMETRECKDNPEYRISKVG